MYEMLMGKAWGGGVKGTHDRGNILNYCRVSPILFREASGHLSKDYELATTFDIFS